MAIELHSISVVISSDLQTLDRVELPGQLSSQILPIIGSPRVFFWKFFASDYWFPLRNSALISFACSPSEADFLAFLTSQQPIVGLNSFIEFISRAIQSLSRTLGKAIFSPYPGVARLEKLRIFHHALLLKNTKSLCHSLGLTKAGMGYCQSQSK